MFCTDLADAPTDGANPDQPLRHTEKQPRHDQNRQAERRKILKQGCQQGHHTADTDAPQPEHDRAFAAQRVCRPAGKRPAEQGGEVLRSDGQTGNQRAETQLIMDVTGQYRDRQADAQEGDERVEDDGDDLQGNRRGTGLRDRHWTLRWQAVGVPHHGSGCQEMKAG